MSSVKYIRLAIPIKADFLLFSKSWKPWLIPTRNYSKDQFTKISRY